LKQNRPGRREIDAARAVHFYVLWVNLTPSTTCGKVERKEIEGGNLTRQSWLDALNGNPLPWLLEPGNPSVRYLTLRDLLDRTTDDPEVIGARQAILNWGPVRRILDAQWPEGYWMHPGVGYSPKYRATVWQIIFLAAMGVPHCEPVGRAVEYTLAHSRLPDGRFSERQDDQGAVLCLNGNMLRALAWFGYADDSRVVETRRAMAAQIASDGCRCRYNAPAKDRPRRMSDGLPCAWGAVKALGALAALPAETRTPEEQEGMRQAADFLLAHDLAAGDYPTATRPSPLWHKFSFPLGFTSDVLEALEVLLQAGIPADGSRLQTALSAVLAKQNDQGRWLLEHMPGKTWASFGSKNEPNKWVTLRALRVLKQVR
jgi:hypothetical protein